MIEPKIFIIVPFILLFNFVLYSLSKKHLDRLYSVKPNKKDHKKHLDLLKSVKPIISLRIGFDMDEHSNCGIIGFKNVGRGVALIEGAKPEWDGKPISFDNLVEKLTAISGGRVQCNVNEESHGVLAPKEVSSMIDIHYSLQNEENIKKFREAADHVSFVTRYRCMFGKLYTQR